ncbi:hypothetical protein J27TS8_13930 [Robertmurraya siralis]|uniref:YlbE-like protein n=1 Tax=Robertmurraya siralis TaxID=77777 RepID=A0A920BSS4_9BACI|nr:YlbE-like family protein [Robertmurraya siralis]PAE19246.1 hypothetical protein CHH80_17760 [Bacillus sp. 7504-2]GIN61400.1 hypothetical protein J27TS8_13930 [Robertmurraya siralis]
MRKDMMEMINADPDLKRFLHEQPIWYRKLARNPNDFQAFQIAALHYHRKTIPHRVEKFSNGVYMAQMMMSMFQAMNNNLS